MSIKYVILYMIFFSKSISYWKYVCVCVGSVHTCTKQWSLCEIFGKNGLKSMWCYNLIKHLVISRTEKNIKEMLPKWIYGTFPTTFWSTQPCVHLSLLYNAMKYCWKVTNKDEKKISKKIHHVWNMIWNLCSTCITRNS